MKNITRFLLILAMLLTFNINTNAQKTGKVDEICLKSASVDINILGDTTSKKVLVYLPPSYETSSKKYPVVYFLTGYGTEVDILFENGLKLTLYLDAKSISREINEMIMVVATSKIRLNYNRMVKSPYTWGTFYENSPVTGNWEDFVTKELVPYIDSNYRTINNKNARAIAGHSMGGLGALTIGLKNPDLFGCIYSISAGIIKEGDLESSWMFESEEEKSLSLEIIQKLSKPDCDLNIYQSTLTNFIETDSLFNSNVILSFAYGSAYFGEVNLYPPYFKYPFELKNDEIVRNDSVWKLWNNKLTKYQTIIDTYKNNEISIENIVIEFGTNDNNKLTQGNQNFSSLLFENGISHEFRYFIGKHGDLNPRIREFMLPYLSDHLNFK